MNTSKSAREALISWLEKQKVASRIDTPPKAEKPVTWIEPKFGAGSVVLARGVARLRVVWPLGGKDVRRELEPGPYKVRSVAMERKVGDALWYATLSGPPYKPFVVGDRGVSKLVIDDRLKFKGQAKLDGKVWRLGFTFRSKTGGGVTVFKDGKRIAVSYRVLDKDGKLLASGKTNYG